MYRSYERHEHSDALLVRLVRQRVLREGYRLGEQRRRVEKKAQRERRDKGDERLVTRWVAKIHVRQFGKCISRTYREKCLECLILK